MHESTHHAPTECILEALEVVAVLSYVSPEGLGVEGSSLKREHEGVAEGAEREVLVLRPERLRDGLHPHFDWRVTRGLGNVSSVG